ncbi:Anaphase-promoting complex subunit 10 [Rhizophlyctis rosea]|nr:Anaphase-promoting complex subunit 10 [Rhizophlyctis rosea]
MTAEPPHLREISPAAHWSLSSFKPGFGLDELRDNSTEKFWQYASWHDSHNVGLYSAQLTAFRRRSDAGAAGPPHSITLTFPKKTDIKKVKIWLDTPQDESYCPSVIKIKAGNSLWDAQEVYSIEVNENMEETGWRTVELWEDETIQYVPPANVC